MNLNDMCLFQHQNRCVSPHSFMYLFIVAQMLSIFYASPVEAGQLTSVGVTIVRPGLEPDTPSTEKQSDGFFYICCSLC